MHKLLVATTAAMIAVSAAASGQAADTISALAPDVPAGAYTLDRAHASLLFRVDHMGFSKYTARFTRFDAHLDFDPKHPAASRLLATVDARSLETDFPFTDQVDFNAQIEGRDWLDAEDHPEMTFRSTNTVPTGTNTARVDGKLTLRGVTRPMTLKVTFNGGYAGHPMDPNARIGFSAHGTLLRSEFGMMAGIPPPGSQMGVGDTVDVIIEAEFSGPPWRHSTPPD